MNSGRVLTCFKSYDVRGKLGDEFNSEIAYRIGRATAETLKAKTLVLGFDARKTSADLAQSITLGICDAGADVIELGLAGTEEMYAAVSEFNASGGIEVTASHNPIDYNGMKIVKHGSQPLSTNEFASIQHIAEANKFNFPRRTGLVINKKSEARESYIEKIMAFINIKNLKPLKIVINSGNGTAGPTVDALNNKFEKKGLKTNFIYVHHEPNPLFPNGIPNPLLEENRFSTTEAIIKEKADFGVAFDGDFDRCFLFDHLGNFIPGEYLVGLLAEVFLKKEKGATIVHDPRIIWNTTDIINNCEGHAFESKTGHAYVKAAMRLSGAIYGGEMSAHHYFRDFAYCDSGMIPWLLIWELLSSKNQKLKNLIVDRKCSFPSSGEINFTVHEASKCLQRVKKFYLANAHSINELDGLSMSFGTWRFNLRQSNTEPLVRLNVETKGNRTLLEEKTEELRKFILNF